MTVVARSRRRVLAAGGIGLAALAVRSAAMPLAPGGLTAFLSAATSADGRHWAVGLDGAGRERFRAPLPMRGHQMVASADGTLGFAAPRRPGTKGFVLDLASRRVLAACESAPGRHFVGHGVFAADGALLFTAENDHHAGRGLIVARETSTLNVAAEWDSGGIGPHELRLMGDGRTLVVANGGILTRPNQPRRKLNVATMRPNLSLIDAASGRLIDQVRLPNHQASIRHLAATAADEVVVGMQYEGPPGDDVPLLAAYRAPGSLVPLAAPLDHQRSMRQYVASVAVDPAGRVAVATCPRANLVTFWDVRTGRYAGRRRLRDAGGAAFAAAGREFVVSTGQGAIVRFDADTLALRDAATVRIPDLKWDNHLTAIA